MYILPQEKQLHIAVTNILDNRNAGLWFWVTVENGLFKFF